MFIKQKGQALSEVLVIGGSMVLLLLASILLGRLQSIREASIDASRALMFECTVRDCVGSKRIIEREIQKRYFYFPTKSVSSLEMDMAEQPLWHDRKGRRFLQSFKDVRTNIRPISLDAGRNVAIARTTLTNPSELLGRLAGPGRFGLEERGGFLKTEVLVSLAPELGKNENVEQLKNRFLGWKLHGAILTNTWSASGPYGSDDTSVAQRIDKGRRLDRVRENGIRLAYKPVVSAIKLLSSIGLEPSGRHFKPYAIDVDLVPPDRLSDSGFE